MRHSNRKNIFFVLKSLLDFRGTNPKPAPPKKRKLTNIFILRKLLNILKKLIDPLIARILTVDWRRLLEARL